MARGSPDLMQCEMGLVQLLGLANQLILDGDVSSAQELQQNPQSDIQPIKKVYVQLRFLLTKQK